LEIIKNEKYASMNVKENETKKIRRILAAPVRKPRLNIPNQKREIFWISNPEPLSSHV
jgi:hypothetical protein